MVLYKKNKTIENNIDDQMKQFLLTKADQDQVNRFCGYEVSELNEDTIDDVISQMPEDEFDAFVTEFGLQSDESVETASKTVETEEKKTNNTDSETAVPAKKTDITGNGTWQRFKNWILNLDTDKISSNIDKISNTIEKLMNSKTFIIILIIVVAALTLRFGN